jgi:hypothetical protein
VKALSHWDEMVNVVTPFAVLPRHSPSGGAREWP